MPLFYYGSGMCPYFTMEVAYAPILLWKWHMPLFYYGSGICPYFTMEVACAPILLWKWHMPLFYYGSGICPYFTPGILLTLNHILNSNMSGSMRG